MFKRRGSNRLLSRLFWKVFLWFWGATIGIGLVLYFFVLTTRPDPVPPNWRRSVAISLASTGTVIVTAWERKGKTGLRAAIYGLDRSWQNGVWLFDSSGRELSDTKITGPPPGVHQNEHPTDGFSEDTLKAMASSANGGMTQFQPAPGGVVAAQPIQSQSGNHYVFIVLLPPPPEGRTLATPPQQLIGGLLVMTLSGLICFGLVRYLTSPLIKLREATHRFAEGELGARTFAAQHGRRDEVADLGRDFDTMAEQIENMVEAQRQLLGDISHELRSPLTRLNMALALSRRCANETASGEAMQNALDRIGRESKRVDALIGQLLELARLESGDATAQQNCDLQELLREVVEDAQFEAEANQRTVEITNSSRVVIAGAPSLLLSAFENVVRNALRYTRPNTAVEVSLKIEAASAVIRVRDHGPGVPEESLSRLFTPFYRVEAARDRNSGGVGLGLAITERSIVSHGGTVQARNHTTGGLEVEIRLPTSPLKP